MKAAGLALFATGATGKSALYWTAHPGFVLDVNGFQSNYPKPIMLWERDSSAPNDNEFFTRNSDGTISWASDKSKGFCLEAASSDNGADVQVNYCSKNPLQKWSIETSPPETGFRLVSTSAKKCLNVEGNTAKNSQRLQLWDCNDDKQQSFTANQDPTGWPSDGPSPAPSECGACVKSSNHCYTKFNFKDGECKCVNSDGKCGNSWYQWICGSGDSVAFIDSGCAQCHGLKNAPCPRSGVTVV